MPTKHLHHQLRDHKYFCGIFFDFRVDNIDGLFLYSKFSIRSMQCIHHQTLKFGSGDGFIVMLIVIFFIVCFLIAFLFSFARLMHYENKSFVSVVTFLFICYILGICSYI